MLFHDSCVTQVSDFSCTEESTALPVRIFPAYVGTGNTVLSLDASGLQCLNHGVQDAFGGMPGSGDMYVVSHGMMSDILSPDNVHPYGYLTWELDREGRHTGPDTLPNDARVWKRRIYLEQGRVVTSLLVDDLRMELDVTALMGTDRFLIRARFAGYDRSNRPVGARGEAVCSIHLNLSTRQGAPTLHTPSWDGQILRGRYQGREDYAIAIGMDAVGGRTAFDGSRLTASFAVPVSGDWHEVSLLLDFSPDDSRAGRVPSAAWFDELFSQNWELRRSQFRSTARLDGLDPKQRFLYHNTLHLIRSCFVPEKGFPIGAPFYFPWCWRCSTFWDSTFLMDGLMRLGDRDSADRFLRFLHRCMNPTGKPFSWMFAYDGHSTVEDDRDIAPLVMCAHAMTAIRHYEYFQDREFLQEYGYPILKRVSVYAAETLFGQDEEGRWYLSIPVSNDVVEEAAHEINQTFTLVWFLTLFKKCLEYGRMFGEELPLLEQILSRYRIDQTDEEYLHSQGIRASEHNCASWIPFLLYPTEGTPFLDPDKMDRTRKKYSWEELYMDLQGCYQPWTEMMQSCSDLRRGDPEEADRLFQLALTHTFGPGYFSEIGPMQETVGMPPYVSAHGTFLDYLSSLYVQSDLWDGSLGLFTGIPNALRGRTLRFAGICCCQGIRASGLRTHGRLEACLTGCRSGLSVNCLLPEGLELSDAEVYVNGRIHPFATADRRRRILRLTIDLEDSAQILIQ